MGKSLKDLASAIGGTLIGGEDCQITGVASIDEAKEGDITFLANPKYQPYLDKTEASAVIVSRDTTWKGKPVILTDDPSLAFSKAVEALYGKRDHKVEGIHPSAVISESADIGKGAAIGAGAFIGPGAVIGEDTIIYPNAYIGEDVRIGSGCVIYPNVNIMHSTVIGDNVIIHPSTVIGSDGFGYAPSSAGLIKIPQVGTVVIESDVEIGSCVTVDRARFGKTVIGRGTKIDNLVQIAHNVVIGKNSIIVSQTGISGSSKLGDNVVLAGQVGVVGHVTIGDNVKVAAQSGVNKSLKGDDIFLGSPARPISEQRKIYVCMGKLPQLFKDILKIKKKLGI